MSVGAWCPSVLSLLLPSFIRLHFNTACQKNSPGRLQIAFSLLTIMAWSKGFSTIFAPHGALGLREHSALGRVSHNWWLELKHRHQLWCLFWLISGSSKVWKAGLVESLTSLYQKLYYYNQGFFQHTFLKARSEFVLAILSVISLEQRLELCKRLPGWLPRSCEEGESRHKHGVAGWVSHGLLLIERSSCYSYSHRVLQWRSLTTIYKCGFMKCPIPRPEMLAHRLL